MINKLLIANRGEIACRIIQTAKKMGIETVAVYSCVDKNARHVMLADEAYFLGEASSAESYLNIEKLLKIAQLAKVDAIHPGYGFLSENSLFAERCSEAGINFVGPTPNSIALMGSKSQAKLAMAKANIPLVPGYHANHQDDATLLKAANEIGFPLLIKAAYGGGGKGMRIVDAASDIKEHLDTAKREAKNAFGNDEVILERYIANPRHIEVQILADKQGKTLHLFERDCSIQRRYQKIIEESPALGISEKLRNEICRTAVLAARSIDYVGAGTIEFLLGEDEQFYFMEMNTRLQVEHPVTEMITGIDLVEWQLRIADNEPLTLEQEDIAINGHAIEARIYAENPDNHFLPATGKVTYFSIPEANTNTRIDSGIQLGDTITTHYDPMLAKLIVWGKDRTASIALLKKQLGKFHLIGLKSNLTFLKAIANHHDFQNGNISTHFINNNEASLLAQQSTVSDEILVIAALYDFKMQTAQFKNSNDCYSPWAVKDAWQANLPSRYVSRFVYADKKISCSITHHDKHYLIEFDGKAIYATDLELTDNTVRVTINEKRCKASIVVIDQYYHVLTDNEHITLTRHNTDDFFDGTHTSQGELLAPMPGNIAELKVSIGDKVQKGDKLLIIEAMKMEHTIIAPHDGVINDLFFKQGEQVSEGAELLRLTADTDETTQQS